MKIQNIHDIDNEESSKSKTQEARIRFPIRIGWTFEQVDIAGPLSLTVPQIYFYI